MGQPVAVEQSAGGSPAIVRFETNRSLTGMGHERFTSADQAKGPRPAAVLARLAFGVLTSSTDTVRPDWVA